MQYVVNYNVATTKWHTQTHTNHIPLTYTMQWIIIKHNNTKLR